MDDIETLKHLVDYGVIALLVIMSFIAVFFFIERVLFYKKIDVKIKREMEDVKVPSGEKFLGHEFTKTVKKKTGNLIISEEDFLKLDSALKIGREKEEQLNKILDSWIFDVITNPCSFSE